MPQVQAPAIDPVKEAKPISQSEKIIKLLRQAGSKGVANYKFPEARILRYSSRIRELRQDGFNIYCERQSINGRATGVWMYYLNEG